MKPITILLIEDNPDHALIIEQGLKVNSILNQIKVARDGQEALDYLYHQGAYADPEAAPRPGLILLDIKLPKMSGLDILQRIKQDPALKPIPVVMLTSSEQEADMKKSYEYGANSYITKPIQFTEFMQKVRQLQLYWVLVNSLPTESNCLQPALSGA
jgi:two-component system, response regulator